MGLNAAAAVPAPEVPDNSVLEAVQSLPCKYREAIYFYYYEGYDIKEIAGLLDISESAATARIDRGRKKLRKIMGGDYSEA